MMTYTKKSLKSLLKNPNLLRDAAYIDGRWVGALSSDGRAGSNALFNVVNPYSGDVVGHVPDMGGDDALLAVQAAHDAFYHDAHGGGDGRVNWRNMVAHDRAAILQKWYDLIMANQDDLAIILTAEQGKPLAESRGEIAYGASFILWYAQEARRLYGDIIPSHNGQSRMLSMVQPVGVCAAITPWNFPNAMITRKAAPALAAGCTMVVKPAEDTPLSALALAYLAGEAGIPPGVLNIITGQNAKEIGAVLTGDERVRKISFTGSTQTGRILMRQSASTIKRISLELGGNAPLIVFEDADIDRAVTGAIQTKFRNAGQTCVCANRIFVHDKIHDEFVKKFVAKVSAMQTGNGMDDGVEIGPLINDQAVQKVQSHLDDALAKGAKLLTGGELLDTGRNLMSPAILDHVTPNMIIMDEETFGPVAPIITFNDDDQVIAMANDTIYGLASYVFTQNLSRAWRMAEELEFGIVSINEGIFSTPQAPFGGVKQSGIGREGSKYGIDEYIERKYVLMGI